MKPRKVKKHLRYIDYTPWLSLRSVGEYIDYKSLTSVRRFINTNWDSLEIKRIPGGQLRVKQSSIDRVLCPV